MTPSDLLQQAFDRFDEVNARDPRRDRVGGEFRPRELVYGRRMTERLERFDPRASEALQLAARAQHIARWEIPRSDYPMDRTGYKRWRSTLMLRHAEIASEILEDVGYEKGTVDAVARLLRKVGLGRDPETQTLEDVVCLVFLEHYFDDFAKEHDDEKLIQILRRTWRKMSSRGQAAALELGLSDNALRLVERAINTEGTNDE